ncbi:MAG: HAMP domain-containing sensor histidine kinase [Thermodesulfobacteriota bacterium]
MESPFIEFLFGAEDTLVERILADSHANGYARYLPGDPKVWRPTVRGVTGSIVQAYRTSAQPPPLDADEMGREDGLTAFLVVEARKHRIQGVPQGAFLGIVKLLRRAYADLLRSAGFSPEEEAGYRLLVERFFDRNEAAACVAWAGESLREQAEELAAGALERGNARIEEALDGLRRMQAERPREGEKEPAGRMAERLAREIRRPVGVVAGNLAALRSHMARLRKFLAEQSSCIDKGSPPHLAEAVRRRRGEVDEILEDAAGLIGETLDEAERVLALVGEMKGFERKAEGEFRQADVNDCLREAVLSVRDAFKDRATLDRRLGRLPRTRCHPPQLTRAFSDLLGYAARSVRKGGAVTVRSWVEDGCVRVSVGDAGREIPEELLGRIFEPFPDAAENGAENGARLGLSAAHDIVGRHGGEIRVRSSRGAGTEFIVSVPLVKES